MFNKITKPLVRLRDLNLNLTTGHIGEKKTLKAAVPDFHRDG